MTTKIKMLKSRAWGASTFPLTMDKLMKQERCKHDWAKVGTHISPFCSDNDVLRCTKCDKVWYSGFPITAEINEDEGKRITK